MRNSYFGQGGRNRSRSILGPAYHEAKELDLHWTVVQLIDLWTTRFSILQSRLAI